MTVEASSTPLVWSTLAVCATTAIVWQWFQHRQRRKKQLTRDEDELQFREMYQLRRAKNRISHDNLFNSRFFHHTGFPGQENESSSLYFPAMDERLPNSDRLAVASDEAGEDIFHPKNKNWNHFERQASHLSTLDDSGSSEEEADEETFMWTGQAKRHGHRTTEAPTPTNGFSESSWTNKLRQVNRHTPVSALRALKRGVGSRGASDDEASYNADPVDSGEVGDTDAFMNIDSRNGIPPAKYNRQTSDPAASVAVNRRKRAPHRSMSMPDIVDHKIKRRGSETNREVAAYNRRIMPSKVIMIRHGQSEANVNESLYATTPDNAMRITKLGWEQARMAGKALKGNIIKSGEPVHFIVSPYVRTVETFHGIVSAWCDPSEFDYIADRDERLKAWYGRLLEMGLTWYEDPRIREQDFGNYQDPETIRQCKRERLKFGVFFYRFPHGESASDVFDRVSTFLDSLWRSFDMHRSRNYVLVTHGIAIRVFLARYFRYTIEQFSMLANPRNCEMVILGHDGEGKLGLDGRCEVEVQEKENEEGDVEKEVVGYKFHKRLRTIPQSVIPKVKILIRVSYND